MRYIQHVLVLLAAIMFTTPALAQDYPTKPIRLVIPFAPGGSTDIIGRLVGQKLSEALKQPVIVENKPGAGGAVGARSAVQAAPDGYTLVFSGSSWANLSVFVANLGFDPMVDFVPVATLAEIPIAIVAGAGTPFRTLKELIDAAKARPGTLTYGSPGVGTSAHLTCETIKFRLGLNIVHVPYKGNGPAVNDMMGGHIPLVCSNLSGLPDLTGQRLRILAVTGVARDTAIPQVPTFREAGVAGMDRGTWVAFSAPANTPAQITERLNTEIARILRMPDVVERFKSAGAIPMISTRAEFAERLESVRRDLAELKRSTGLTLD